MCVVFIGGLSAADAAPMFELLVLATQSAIEHESATCFHPGFYRTPATLDHAPMPVREHEHGISGRRRTEHLTAFRCCTEPLCELLHAVERIRERLTFQWSRYTRFIPIGVLRDPADDDEHADCNDQSGDRTAGHDAIPADTGGASASANPLQSSCTSLMAGSCPPYTASCQTR